MPRDGFFLPKCRYKICDENNLKNFREKKDWNGNGMVIEK